MRLLSTHPADETYSYTSLELYDFQVPPAEEPYAILSHTWGKLIDEILYSDLFRICNQDVLQDDGITCVDLAQGAGSRLTKIPGWHKIRSSLQQAWQDGCSWLWADTLCIDKSSSAELSEAINRSAVCYVFLEDVSYEQSRLLLARNCLDSRWATRGWTLQELLAPTQVHFFSSDWQHIGDKHGLAHALHATTGIDVAVLEGRQSIWGASVAKRMSWASQRQTTRPEDRAYSLMGLFDVNMPMLYGEGKKAFLRLQEEILRTSNDHSLFAWKSQAVPNMSLHGLLADSPEDFRDSSQYRSYFVVSDPISLTSRGLSISLHMSPSSGDEWTARLQCPHPEKLEGYLVIRLKKLHTGDRDFGRVHCSFIDFTPRLVSGEVKSIFVSQKLASTASVDALMPKHIVRISTNTTRLPLAPENNLAMSAFQGLKLCNVWHGALSSTLKIGNRAMKTPQIPLSLTQVKEANTLSSLLVFDGPTAKLRIVVMLGTDANGEVAFDSAQCSANDPLASLRSIFNPRPIGSTVDVPGYAVEITGTGYVRSGVKVHMLDLIFHKRELVAKNTTWRNTWRTTESDESASSGASGVQKLKKILTLGKSE